MRCRFFLLSNEILTKTKRIPISHHCLFSLLVNNFFFYLFHYNLLFTACHFCDFLTFFEKSFSLVVVCMMSRSKRNVHIKKFFLFCCCFFLPHRLFFQHKFFSLHNKIKIKNLYHTFINLKTLPKYQNLFFHDNFIRIFCYIFLLFRKTHKRFPTYNIISNRRRDKYK